MKYLNVVIPLLLTITLTTFSSCSKKEGCTDVFATNYDSDAEKDDGSCAHIFGCTDPSSTNYNSLATKDNSTCEYNGDVVFWQYSGSGFGATVVNIDGETHTITSEYLASPNCWASGCATFSLSAESGGTTYAFGASDGSSTWGGSITVHPNDCTKMLLN